MKRPEKASPKIERCEITLPGSKVTTSFCRIPKGEFRLGSRGYGRYEEPAQVVRIGQDIWLGQYPVTPEQFAIWAKAKRIKQKNDFPDQPQHPAKDITWRQAVRFCNWLTKEAGEQFPAGYGLACLPTEAEWEYACRAGTETEYHTGNGESALKEAGWYNRNSESSTHPVGERQPNPWGLFDMHGNVWEWCHDEWDEAAYRKRRDGDNDPGFEARAQEYRKGIESMLKRDVHRVLRGGSWGYAARYCRSAFRFRWGPDVSSGGLGFRVCLVPSPALGGAPSPAAAGSQPERAAAVPRDSETAEDRLGGKIRSKPPKCDSAILDTAGFSDAQSFRKKRGK